MNVPGGRATALIAVAALALVGVAACSSKDDEDATSGNGSGESGSSDTTAAVADVLGEPNEATGTPITIGVVTDGSRATPEAAPFLDTIDATVAYVNEHLGGINGHVLEVDECSTDATPSGATLCGVQMAGAGVAAVVVPVSTQDSAILEGLGDSGIPYVTYTSASSSILLQPGAFLLTNPISQIAVPGLVAQEEGLDKVGFIIIDVPAATGPITQIAEPIYESLGIDLQIIPIAPSVADMTPQIQEAIGGGADVFTVTGTDDFNVTAINALQQLGFEGPVVTGALAPIVIDGVADGIEGVIGTGTLSDDPSDEDVELFHAVLAEYAPDVEPEFGTSMGFAVVLSFVRALTGAADALDAASITAALNTMPEPVPLAVGGGTTFQCGTAPVAFAPNICSIDVLRWTYGPEGERSDYGVLEVPPEVLTLG